MPRCQTSALDPTSPPFMWLETVWVFFPLLFPNNRMLSTPGLGKRVQQRGHVTTGSHILNHRHVVWRERGKKTEMKKLTLIIGLCVWGGGGIKNSGFPGMRKPGVRHTLLE